MSASIMVLLGLLIVGFVSGIVTLWFGIEKLARKDIFFTTVKENTIKVITIAGAAVKYLMRVRGKKMDPVTSVVSDVPVGSETRGFWAKHFGGIEWIGIPPYPKIYKKKFKWVKFDLPTGGGTVGEIIRKEEEIDSFLYRSNYAIEASSVETHSKVPLNIVVALDVAVENADTMLFKTNNWFSALTAAVVSAIKDFVGVREFEDIVSMKVETSASAVTVTAKDKSGILEAMLSLNDTAGAYVGLKDRIGVSIKSANVVQVEIAGSKEAVAASQAKYIAKQKAEGTIAEAQGKAKAAVIKAKGDAASTLLNAKADAEAKKLAGNAEAEVLASKVGKLGVEGHQLSSIELSAALKVAKPGTLVLGGSVMPTVDVGGGSKKTP